MPEIAGTAAENPKRGALGRQLCNTPVNGEDDPVPRWLKKRFGVRTATHDGPLLDPHEPRDLAVDINDIRQPHERLAAETSKLARRIELKKKQERIRVERLEDQVSILHDQLGDAEENSRTDGLTGLYNCRGFDEILRTEHNFACRLGREVSLVICDIDRCKEVNDQHGHQAGDEILTHLAARSRSRSLPAKRSTGPKKAGATAWSTLMRMPLRLLNRKRRDIRPRIWYTLTAW